MNSLQVGRKEYQSGMRMAKLDVFYVGSGSAWGNYHYGLNGKSDTFCKGYLAYLTNFAKRM